MGDQPADSELIAKWAASETIPDIAVGLAGLKAWEAERAAQQNAYYDSELRAVRDSITSTGAEVRYLGFFGVKAKSRFEYACWSVQQTNWFRSLWGARNIYLDTVRRKRHWANAEPEKGRILVPRSLRLVHILLHEMAHCLSPAKHGHGPIHSRIMLILWENTFGQDAADVLAARFRTSHIPVITHYDARLYPPAAPVAPD